MKTGCDGKVNERRVRELPVINSAAGSSKPNTIRHSRTSRWRAFALITVNALMAIHIIQWAIMGYTVSPIEPSEAMYTLQNGYVNAGAIFFGIAILATLVLGRFVCGWGCHIVSLQDLCAWMLKKVGLTPKPFRSRVLVYVPLIVALYMFVWPTVLRIFTTPKGQPKFPEFTNHLMTTEFWATFPPVAVAIPFLFICGFMTVYFLGAKGFCTYGCPYGGFFGVADKVAPGRIRVTDACNNCGHCTAVCTSNVAVHAEVKEHKMVVDPGCMKCMDCVSVCPNDALYYGFGKPSLGITSERKPVFSLTWPEEIFTATVFALSYFAVWNVYQLVPMLMALGIAAVTTFVAFRLYRLVLSRDSAFYGRALRSKGKFTSAGFAFAAFAVAWIGLVAHSGVVRYFERAGNAAFESLRIPEELGLAKADASEWLSPSDRTVINEGRRAFATATDIALFTNRDAISKYAWLEHLSGDTDAAIDRLAIAGAEQTGRGRAIALYYRGALLNRKALYNDAISSLESAIAEQPGLYGALEELGESYWRTGDREKAIATWRSVADKTPDMVVTNNLLAGAFSAIGDEASATRYAAFAERQLSSDAYFNWMIGLRLSNVGFNDRADKYFRRAIQIDSSFRERKR